MIASRVAGRSFGDLCARRSAPSARSRLSPPSSRWSPIAIAVERGSAAPPAGTRIRLKSVVPPPTSHDQRDLHRARARSPRWRRARHPRVERGDRLLEQRHARQLRRAAPPRPSVRAPPRRTTRAPSARSTAARTAAPRRPAAIVAFQRVAQVHQISCGASTGEMRGRCACRPTAGTGRDGRHQDGPATTWPRRPAAPAPARRDRAPARRRSHRARHPRAARGRRVAISSGFGKVQKRWQHRAAPRRRRGDELRDAEQLGARIAAARVDERRRRVGRAEIDPDQKRRGTHLTRIWPRGCSAPASSDARRRVACTRAPACRPR